MSVLLLPERSALPPSMLGITLARALSTVPPLLRVPMPLADGSKTGRASRQFSGSFPDRERLNSAAVSVWAAL